MVKQSEQLYHLQIIKNPADTARATDPTNARRFETAPLSAGPGASDGGEIEEGGLAGASEDAGDSDGGELTAVGDGAAA